METTMYKGYEIKIGLDEMPENPRDVWDDNFGTMVCFHRRYTLGDKHNFSNPDEASEFAAMVEKSGGVVLPLYLLDHSGITMRTTSFNDPWDSGQVGIIYAERSAILSEYNVKKISKKVREKAISLLESEVKTYDRYITGEVYYYTIKKDSEKIDSCYGFFDSPEYVLNEAKDIVDAREKESFLQRLSKLKTFIRNHVPLHVRQTELKNFTMCMNIFKG